MTLLRPAPLIVALLAWVSAHVALAALTLASSTSPGLTMLAVAVGAAGCLVVLLPLRPGRTTLRARAATGAAALPPLVAAVNGLTVVPGALMSYAHWWPGLAALVVGGLVVHRRPLHAAACSVACVAVLAAVMATRAPGPWVPGALALAAYLPVWFVGGTVVGRFLDSSEADLRRSEGLRWAAAERERGAAGLREQRRRRAALLQWHAVPVLARMAAGAEVDDDLRHRAALAEEALRTELRGGDLLDSAVRAARAAAERRGVVVEVVDDEPLATPAACLALARWLVEVCLRECTDGELTARRPAAEAGVLLTVVHVGSPTSVAAVAAALRRAQAEAPELVVDETDDAVVAELPAA